MLFEAVKEQLKRLDEIEVDAQDIERSIKDWQKQQSDCRRIAEIPDVGMLMANALAVTMGEANYFKSGRAFAACVRLVPRQSGAGDTY